MKQLKFTLSENNEEGLTFITYLMKMINLQPGESKLVTIRDKATGWYEDWSDEDILTYYNERYSQYGLTTEIIQNGPNFP